ncbi:MAG: acyl carrier protein [Lachnospiraceae bacterium]|nr:acyl carrier protein [Lachnospiraceae bacterium]MDD6448198.1 acyl carrier protein [Lachnospiraceae bacterium]MDD6451794.1 acyl carrier protein [Lachnospiraceae bacterium]MDD6578540.1 acyl carrier protein [Lachnospiraceae bacterium]
MREKILEILNDIDDSVDYLNEKSLIGDHILDSFGIINLVGELEEEFDISIGPEEMVQENFDSVDDIEAMVERLAEEG